MNFIHVSASAGDARGGFLPSDTSPRALSCDIQPPVSEYYQDLRSNIGITFIYLVSGVMSVMTQADVQLTDIEQGSWLVISKRSTLSARPHTGLKWVPCVTVGMRQGRELLSPARRREVIDCGLYSDD